MVAIVPAWRFALGFLFALGLAFHGYRKKSLSLSGAIAAMLVGLGHTLVGFTPTVSLVLFYFTSSQWTKWKAGAKAKIEGDHKEGGQRDWVQVVANGGAGLVATLIHLSVYGFRERTIDFILAPNHSTLIMVIIAIYAAANADTWSSEIGTLSKGLPRLITTCKEVPKGTNGGVSLLGTYASIAGGFVIGIGAFLAQVFLVGSPMMAMWPLIPFATICGLVGSLADSLIGATLQYSGVDVHINKVVSVKTKSTRHISGYPLLDNNEVNLASIVVTALFGMYVAPYFMYFGTYI